jgi:hypothetical protein
MTEYSAEILARTTPGFREALEKSDGPHRVILGLALSGNEPESPMRRHRFTDQEREARVKMLENAAVPIAQALASPDIGFTIREKYTGVGPGEATILPITGSAIIVGTRDQLLKAIEIPGVESAMMDVRLRSLEGETERTADRTR